MVKYQSSASPATATHDTPNPGGNWNHHAQQYLPPPLAPLLNMYPGSNGINNSIRMNQHQQQPMTMNYLSGSSTATNPSHVIWEYLKAQVCFELRSMPPDVRSSRSFELQMLARYEAERQFNTMMPAPNMAIGQPANELTDTGYHPQPYASYTATTSSFVSISPMRRSSTTLHTNQSNTYRSPPITPQYQFGAPARGQMFASSSPPLQLQCQLGTPYHQYHGSHSQAEVASSSTPGKMWDRFVLDMGSSSPATTSCSTQEGSPDGTCQCHSTCKKKSTMSSVDIRLNLEDSPTSTSQPEEVSSSPLKKIMSTSKPSSMKYQTPSRNHADEPSFNDTSPPLTVEMNLSTQVGELSQHNKNSTKTSRHKTNVASKWSDVPFKAKKTKSKPAKRTKGKKEAAKQATSSSGFSPKVKSAMITRSSTKTGSSEKEPEADEVVEAVASSAGVASPSKLDVITGRGGYAYHFEGNKRFREEARRSKVAYDIQTSERGKLAVTEVRL